ncbi:MAG: patatin-like phospholipase family protein [Nanoarchaeota archaeon]|nr:patatin-like phospholipase family protein [Nanoarchaeota archaeon]
MSFKIDSEFRNLVFEGGGVKGAAYGGALRELERIDVLPKITRVTGTSAGAITAVLVALGYSAKEVSGIVAKMNFNDFADDSFGYIFDVMRLLKRFGWHKGNNFYNWISKLIKKRTGRESLTFRELHELSGKNGFKELYIIGTNLSNQCSEIYSYETEQDMEIRDAARISMGIPLYYQAVRRKSDILVDGGVTMNYPIHIFDNKKYLDNKKNGEIVEYNKSRGYVFNHETLGFRLDTKDEMLFNKMGWSNVPKKINNLKNYTTALLNYITESANKKHLHKNDWNRTIFIDTIGVKTTDFNLSKKKINALMTMGEQGVISYFKWKNNKQSK